MPELVLSPVEVLPAFFRNIRQVFKLDRIGREILTIALPAIFILAANPIVSITQMAIIGHLGSVELEAVKASNAGYNLAVNLFTFTLAIITASFVSREKAPVITGADRTPGSVELGRVGGSTNDEVVPVRDFSRERQHLPSASTALVIACFLGLLVILAAIFDAETFLVFMGAESDSPKLTFAARHLRLRSLGAPANLLSSAAQGIFVGFNDTFTPLCAIGELVNIGLHLLLIFGCDMGVSGAAIAHSTSQYVIFCILLWRLNKQVDLSRPSFKDLRFCAFIQKGTLLVLREIAVASCLSQAVTLAVGLDSTLRAATETYLKIWAASSAIAGGLAMAAQAILAGALANKDYGNATMATFRVFQMGFVLGLGLAGIFGVALVGYGVFVEDVHVERLLFVGIPFVGATQAMNSWACVLDGMNFGVSDFAYATYTLIIASIISIFVLFDLVKSYGLTGIWVALTVFTGMRTGFSILSVGFGTGSWSFLLEGHHQRHM